MANTFSDADCVYMRTALDLAALGRFSTSPNPHVGCVMVRNGQIVGQGYHLQAGGPHAEVVALQQAGEYARGADVFVTLEPCSHTGRTGPCAEALVRAGVRRVVAAMTDPNPLVSGKGFSILQAAGIHTASGLMRKEAEKLNRGFLSRIVRGRPFVSLKTACTLDGKTALADGQSRWITGDAAREDVQLQRAQSCAVMTGIGTVLADNPRLTVRLFHPLRPPVRIILDSRLRTPSDSFLATDSSAPTLIVTCEENRQHHRAFEDLEHVDILVAPAGADNRIDLHKLLPLLAARGLGEIMVEGGAVLNSALADAGIPDEIVLYQAPKLLGRNAVPAFGVADHPAALAETPWQTASVDVVGDDIKWVLQRKS